MLKMLKSLLSPAGSGPRGGKIGEPDHEVTIVPAEEPVPKPAPRPEPIREPVPQRHSGPSTSSG
jgi:hypothetical protein